VEAWISTPLSVDEANRLFIETRTCVNSVVAAGRKVVIVCDLTQVNLFAPEVSDKLLQIMRGDTPQMERGAYWLSEALPMFSLQFQRMIREAGNPERRIFTRRLGLESWASERLTPYERERLHEFLDSRERELATFTARGVGS